MNIVDQVRINREMRQLRASRVQPPLYSGGKIRFKKVGVGVGVIKDKLDTVYYEVKNLRK